MASAHTTRWGGGQVPPWKARGVKFAPSGTQKCLKMGKKYVFCSFCPHLETKNALPWQKSCGHPWACFPDFSATFHTDALSVCHRYILYLWSYIFYKQGHHFKFFQGRETALPFQTLTWTPPPPKNFTSDLAHYKSNIGIFF